MKRMIVAMTTMALLSSTALAAEIPLDVTVQTLNGSQQYIETYTVDPSTDPLTLVMEDFQHEGYTYSYSSVIKEEHQAVDAKTQAETIVVETSSKDLSDILAQLSTTIDYADGGYTGTLALDHTSLQTEAAGYTTKSYTVTDTVEYPNLPSNDMSYVQSTTLKDGKTLTLAAVEWQVQATSLVGDTLVPSQYKAIATYSSNASYSAATGYLTTATYTGEVTRSELDSITYTVTYLGEEIPAPVVEEETPSTWDNILTVMSNPYLVGATGGVLGMLLIFALIPRKKTAVAVAEVNPDEVEVQPSENDTAN